eukprot:3345368-Rhodomonas_salina.1
MCFQRLFLARWSTGSTRGTTTSGQSFKSLQVSMEKSVVQLRRQEFRPLGQSVSTDISLGDVALFNLVHAPGHVPQTPTFSDSEGDGKDLFSNVPRVAA